ncbi:hypothetical protein [Bdellovibrio sp. NC01]|uniref:hypothetical protein n=1 Tax=Bdellovibrio sp. NC01 TaxID=2220073 RepID=UPI0011589ECF|nr:hypothetical protein [Bdellovibrio sp. NC01]QDK36255.1 hypothetical protein DOE51_00905 [Bdellovibrio sp. NC01]
MKSVKLAIAVVTALMSVKAMAADQVQTLQGRGIDGKACAVTIVRDGNNLKSVKLQGASKVFEILSENGGSYGPKTSINSRGGEEVLQLAEENQALYKYFTHSENIFSNGEVFKLDTNDIPRNGEESLKGIKMVIQLGLDYDGEELVGVKAQSKAKALLVATLASSQFTCQK